MTEPLKEYGPFTDAAEACLAVGRDMFQSLESTLVRHWAAPLHKRLASRKRLLAALRDEGRESEQSAAVRREAEILAAYRSRIAPGAAEAVLPNLYGEDQVRIALDPALGVQEQIRRRFRLAAKLERKRDALERRIRILEKEAAELEGEILAAEAERDFDQAVSRIDRAKERRRIETEAGRPTRARAQKKELRRFDLDPMWYVLVGRNDRENDEITFRIAGPEDVWMHAQHTPGSHVVLRSREGTRSNPSRFALEAAASIAAHYSKSRRAGLVPVIYTKRKYVRKFKGAKPGQVLCEREKTIFAKPSLPASGPADEEGGQRDE